MILTYEAIAKRAFEIWEREGRPQGQDQELWFRAEYELQEESRGTRKAKAVLTSDASSLKTETSSMTTPAKRPTASQALEPRHVPELDDNALDRPSASKHSLSAANWLCQWRNRKVLSSQAKPPARQIASRTNRICIISTALSDDELDPDLFLLRRRTFSFRFRPDLSVSARIVANRAS